jgi:hypothetical protein
MGSSPKALCTSPRLAWLSSHLPWQVAAVLSLDYRLPDLPQ